MPAGAASAASASAIFVGSDVSTLGAWKGTYGADGYSVSQDAASLPAYAAVGLTGSSDYVWAGSTSDPRALLKSAPGTADRLAACWYSPQYAGGSFDVDVSLTDGQAHRVSLYCLDWDNRGRTDQVTVRDAATGAALDVQTLSAFSGGAYLTWTVKGHVVFHVASPNDFAVLSALFFGPLPAAPAAPAGLTATAGNASVSLSWAAVPGATSYSVYRGTASGAETLLTSGLTATTFTDTGLTNGTAYFYQVTAASGSGEGAKSSEASATPAGPTASAVFVGTDASTQGAWKGTYGADGYSVSQDAARLPAYAQVGLTSSSDYVWAGSTSDPRALLKSAPGTADRLAACWYSPQYAGGGFDVDVSLTDGQAHRVSLYCLDWDNRGRIDAVTVKDAGTGASLDAQTLPAFSGGAYLTWTVKGHVVFHVASPNDFAVLSALFFGPLPAAPAAPTVAAAASATPNPVSGTSTTLSALGADSGGESRLTYTWATAPGTPALVSFSPNGTNSAKNTTATFTGAGSYTLQVTIRNPSGLAVTSGVPVGVNQTTTLSVSPNIATVAAGGTQQFTASATDQFGMALSSPPAFRWSVPTAHGTISTTGLYTAPTAIGSDTVQAISGIVSATASITVVAHTPLAPSSLSAKPGNAQVTLYWSSVPGAMSYNLYRSTTSNSEGLTPYKTGLSGAGYMDTGLTNGTAYYYQVTAVNGSGESAKSSEASATPLLAPSAPTNLVAAAGNSEVGLTWSASVGAASYSVYRSTMSGAEGSTPYRTGVSTTSFTDAGATVTNGQIYYYEVTAVGPTGAEGGPSNEVFATPQFFAPAPTRLTATPGNSQVTLKWVQSPGATGYKVYRGTASSAETLLASPAGAGLIYVDAAAVNGTLYFYYITALTTAGEGSQSNEASATPQAPSAPPLGLSATAGNGQVLLSWNANTGALRYNLKRSTVSGGGYAVIAKLGGSHYTDTPLTNGTPYYYVVSAVTATGEGANSAEASATPGASVPGPRINCGGPAYTDTSGNRWSPDQGFNGGSPASNTASIGNTADAALYGTSRSGAYFTYTLPVSNGSYLLSLLLAETQYTDVGQRRFSVTANGQQVLTNFDIVQAAGGANLATVQSSLVTVIGGQVTLTFSGVTNAATINAIQLTRVAGTVVVDAPLPPWAEDVQPKDEGVNLATGVQEEMPGPDIAVFNPIGPAVSYERMYRSARAKQGYASPGLSPGWTDNYDVTVQSTSPTSWAPLIISYPNGSTETWQPVLGGNSIPTGQFYWTTNGAPYMVTGMPAAVTGQWSSLTVTFSDRSTNVFTPSGGNPNLYLLTRLTDVAGPNNPLGHSVTIQYDGANRLQQISNNTGTPLLSFSYNGAYLGAIQDVSAAATADRRQVTYSFGAASDPALAGQTVLQSVSEDVPPGSPAPTAWAYDYQAVGGSPYLTSVQSIDPSDPNAASMVGTSVAYDSSGRVQQHLDPNGFLSQFFYNGSGGGGSTGVGVYDPSQIGPNNPTGLTAQWSQNFDGSSFLRDVGTTDEEGYSDQAVYADAAHPLLPTMTTNRNNQVSQLFYDPAQPFGQLLQAQDPRGAVANLAYDYSYSPFGDLKTAQVSRNGHSLGADTYAYYPNGLVQSVTSPAPGSVGGSATVTTAFTYDDLGNVITVVGPGNGVATQTLVTYNYTGFTVGAVTYSQSEVLGEPVSVTVQGVGTPDSATTYFEWDGRGRQTATLDALGNETDIQYTGADLVDTVTFPPTNPATFTLRARTHYTYQYPGGPVTAVALYAEGAPLMGAPFRQTTYTYGKAGELKSVQDLKGPVASYTYDGLYRTRSVADGLGQATYYQYDPVGNLGAVLYPNAGGSGYDTTSYVYDPDGNLSQRFDGNGVETDYVYNDPASLLTAIHYPGGQLADVTYGYDDFGRVTATADGTGSKSVTYDDGGAPLNVTTSFVGGPQSQQLVYSYNPDGSRKQLSTPLGNFGYQYDGIGRLTQATFPWAGGFSSHSYLANGWLKRTQGPRTQTLYAYDGRGQLTALRNFSQPDNTLLSSFTGMTYDAAGNRTKTQVGIPALGKAPDGSRTLTYAYNGRDEMTGETSASAGHYGDNYIYAFAYDMAGNPTSSRTPGQSSPLTFGFNLDNQFGDLTYDGNGNPTSYNAGTFSFDAENRLTGVSGPASLSATYDGDGLRASKTGGTGPSFFLYDGETPLVELGASGAVLAGNGWGADGWRSRFYPTGSPLAAPAKLDGQYLAYTFDPQGSLVQRQSQNNGQTRALDTAAFDGYGAKLVDVDALAGGALAYKDPVGFGGQHGYYTDVETGMQLLTHRYYDSGRGRFVNRDPIGYKGGINLYGFCGNNPVNRTDPSGYAGGGREDGKPGASPFVPEAISEIEEAVEEDVEARDARDKAARTGSFGRALALRSSGRPTLQGFRRVGASLVRRAANLANHLRYRDTSVLRSRGIGGAHNLFEFFKYQNEIKIVSMERGPIRGIYRVSYQIKALDPKTSQPVGWKAKVFEKTLYNPLNYSDQEIYDSGLEAAADAQARGAFGREWTGTANNGLRFHGYQNNGEVTSFFPVFHK